MAMVRWQLVSTTRPASSADLDGVSALRKRAAACFLVGAGRRGLPLSLARRHRDGGWAYRIMLLMCAIMPIHYAGIMPPHTNEWGTTAITAIFWAKTAA